jgi:hypothetical protein
MVDYYPVIAEAVSTLQDNSLAARHVLFERVRAILLEQLRIHRPRASELELLRERAALEDAIRRVEADSEMSSLLPHRSANTREVKRRVEDNASSRSFEQRVIAKIPPGRPTAPAERRKFSSEPVATADDVDTRQIQRVRKLDVQVAQSLPSEIIIGQMSFPKSKAVSSEMTRVKTTVGKADQRVELRPASSAVFDTGACTRIAGASGSTLRTSKTGTANSSINKPSQLSPTDCVDHTIAESANGPLFTKLRGIRWLDQLIFDASQPLAQHDLRQDVTTVLRWLDVEEPGAIKTKHYDQFGRAIQSHILQGRTALGDLTSPPTDPVLDDGVRAVFDRLLDREQSALVFDHVLAWFTKIWIAVVVGLNFICMTTLVLSAPTLSTGIVRLSETYSPFNIWTWIAEAVAFSPALGAKAWQDHRLKQPWLSSLQFRMTDLLTVKTRWPRISTWRLDRRYLETHQ